jgi:hypothetical protein
VFPFGDYARQEQLSNGYPVHSGRILDGSIMAIDGCGVTHASFQSETKIPKDSCFWISGFAIIMLAGVDIHGCFLCASSNHSGSTRYIVAWQDSNLYDTLKVQKLLPENIYS